MINTTCNVVIQTAFLGDLFLSIPLLQKLKQQFPHDSLVLVCKKGMGEFFLKEKIADYVFEVVKGDRSSYRKVVIALNKMVVRHLFCVHRSLRSQLMSLQVKAEKKIGFKSLAGSFIFDDQIHFKKAWPEPLRQLQILTSTNALVKAELAENDWAHLNKANSEGQLPQVPANFQNHSSDLVNPKRQIALFPGSVWATKKWTYQGFAQVARAFITCGYEVFLMGGADEKDLCQKIKNLAPGCQILAGLKSIYESVQFIRGCDLVISNDSAPAHMAASQQIPVVSLFGPTTLDLGFRPWSSKVIIIENNNLDCRPCGRHGHQQCPLGHHRCMNEIDAKWVINAGLRLLKN